MKYDNTDYVEFLRKLDGSDVSLTDWEAEFVGSNIDKGTFSDRQREAMDSMIAKYGERIKF